ncbi:MULTISPECIES: carbon monoxide dehydrogenase subunit G [unclassified Brevibacterium]|uniref:SRPBCC family protein n=1 Tax=unclassified Brevibacterium TaxID=2614124 RepID=UPI001C2FC8AF|nr:carbon monoxide dehydrogenase subunit G [Brevibacterium sp. CS2]
MQISSTAHMQADSATAWQAFHDTGVLSRTIPGVESLTPTAPGTYAVVLTMGVAAIKGTYKGTVAFSQEVENESFVLTATGSGGPGTIGADITVHLAPGAESGTDIAWEASAVLGGPIGGVGQRMLSGVAKRIATKFFADIDADIAAGGAAQEASPAGTAPGDALADAAPAPATVPAERRSPPAAASGPAPRGGGDLLTGLLAGAGIALAGVIVGVLAGRR